MRALSVCWRCEHPGLGTATGALLGQLETLLQQGQRGPGEAGLSRPCGMDSALCLCPCAPLAPWVSCSPSWHTSYHIFHVILPRILPLLPTGALQAVVTVIYKNKTSLSLALNLKKQNEVENAVQLIPILSLHLILSANEEKAVR